MSKEKPCPFCGRVLEPDDDDTYTTNRQTRATDEELNATATEQPAPTPRTDALDVVARLRRINSHQVTHERAATVIENLLSEIAALQARLDVANKRVDELFAIVEEVSYDCPIHGLIEGSDECPRC